MDEAYRRSRLVGRSPSQTIFNKSYLIDHIIRQCLSMTKQVGQIDLSLVPKYVNADWKLLQKFFKVGAMFLFNPTLYLQTIYTVLDEDIRKDLFSQSTQPDVYKSYTRRNGLLKQISLRVSLPEVKFQENYFHPQLEEPEQRFIGLADIISKEVTEEGARIYINGAGPQAYNMNIIHNRTFDDDFSGQQYSLFDPDTNILTVPQYFYFQNRETGEVVKADGTYMCRDLIKYCNYPGEHILQTQQLVHDQVRVQKIEDCPRIYKIRRTYQMRPEEEWAYNLRMGQENPKKVKEEGVVGGISKVMEYTDGLQTAKSKQPKTQFLISLLFSFNLGGTCLNTFSMFPSNIKHGDTSMNSIKLENTKNLKEKLFRREACIMKVVKCRRFIIDPQVLGNNTDVYIKGTINLEQLLNRIYDGTQSWFRKFNELEPIWYKKKICVGGNLSDVESTQLSLVTKEYLFPTNSMTHQIDPSMINEWLTRRTTITIARQHKIIKALTLNNNNQEIATSLDHCIGEVQVIYFNLRCPYYQTHYEDMYYNRRWNSYMPTRIKHIVRNKGQQTQESYVRIEVVNPIDDIMIDIGGQSFWRTIRGGIPAHTFYQSVQKNGIFGFPQKWDHNQKEFTIFALGDKIFDEEYNGPNSVNGTIASSQLNQGNLRIRINEQWNLKRNEKTNSQETSGHLDSIIVETSQISVGYKYFKDGSAYQQPIKKPQEDILVQNVRKMHLKSLNQLQLNKTRQF